MDETPPPPPLPPPEPVQAAEQYVLTIGSIGVTPTWVVTQVGSAPLAGSHWTVTDLTRTEKKIPTWAAVCAIVGFFIVAVFSLLFLLARETKTVGYIEVSVASGSVHATTQITVNSPFSAQQVRQQVAQAQTMAAAAAAR